MHLRHRTYIYIYISLPTDDEQQETSVCVSNLNPKPVTCKVDEFADALTKLRPLLGEAGVAGPNPGAPC